MFADAIETVSGYTRAIHIIRRRYGDDAILPDSGTLFFVNDEGCAITSKRIATAIPAAEKLNKNYEAFCKERAQLRHDASYQFEKKLLEKKYDYGKDSIVQMRNSFVDCVQGGSGFTIHFHKQYDLAIVQFNGAEKKLYRGHAVFERDAARCRQGQSLCRLGFPFPEFQNYRFNAEQNTLEWTKDGKPGSPRFPLDGMVTRFLADKDGGHFGIELSTPGLNGQSGGPLFDRRGRVYGMQFGSRVLHLGQDVIEREIRIGTRNEKVTEYGFLRLGQCIHMEVIKAFLREHGVRYYEE